MLFGFAVLVKLRNFSNPWSRPKDIRLFWLLNYNDLHEDTHHYGPSDPVGSFCGIAEKQLYLITYGSVDTVGGGWLIFIPFQFQGCYFGEWHLQQDNHAAKRSTIQLLQRCRPTKLLSVPMACIPWWIGVDCKASRRRHVLKWSSAHSKRRSVCFRRIWCLRLGLFFKEWKFYLEVPWLCYLFLGRHHRTSGLIGIVYFYLICRTCDSKLRKSIRSIIFDVGYFFANVFHEGRRFVA